MNYLSVHDAAEKWGLNERRVTLLCRDGKIRNAKKEGKYWLIPDDAPLPPDGRTKEARQVSPAAEANAEGRTDKKENRKMGKYFGTDGFRGKAGVVLTAEHAFKTGRFLGHYFAARHQGEGNARIVIGKDTRRSSYMFEYSLVGGLVASGADAYLLHVTTTPSVAYVARTEGFECGIMISANHNPYYDNGIKLVNQNGEKMEDAVIDLDRICEHLRVFYLLLVVQRIDTLRQLGRGLMRLDLKLVRFSLLTRLLLIADLYEYQFTQLSESCRRG